MRKITSKCSVKDSTRVCSHCGCVLHVMEGWKSSFLHPLMYICKDCVPGGCHVLGITTEIPFCSTAASGSCDTSTHLGSHCLEHLPSKDLGLARN